MSMPDLRTVQLKNIRLGLRSWGNGSPLLLVHGLGANSRLWANQVEPFGRHFKVLAVDLRGFGGSERPSEPGSYSIDTFASDIAALVHSLKVGPFHYLGTSLGGFIGQALALKEPELFRSLILVHTASRMNIPPALLDSRLGALRQTTMDAYGRLVAGQALAEGSDSRLFRWLSNMIASNDRERYAQVLREIVEFDVTDRISALKIPTLIIVGDVDRVIPPQAGRDLAALITGAEISTLARAGHIGYAEQPDFFNETVISFLQKVQKSGSAN